MCKFINYSVKSIFFLVLIGAGLAAINESFGQVKLQTKATVLIFLDPECPISQAYTLTLRKLHEQYATKGVAFKGIYDSAPLKKRDIRRFHQKYQLPFSGLKDKEYTIARRYGATITPEVVLINEMENVLYRGAIDNWYYALGKNRTEPTEYYLKDALEATLGHYPIVKKQTQAVGCLMNR